jgi:ComF family protein
MTCHPDFPYRLGAAGNYQQGSLGALIQALKFNYIKEVAPALAELMARFIARAKVTVSRGAEFVLVPIPLSEQRERSRGFNQSELIVKHLAGRIAMPIDTGSLIRTRYAKPQSEMTSVAERQQNIRGSFHVPTPEALSGKHVLLVDDVTTSGATFYEASLALRASGVTHITALAAAKA